MLPEHLLLIIVLIVALNYLYSTWLDGLNYINLGAKIPSSVEDVYPKDEYQKSQNYNKERAKFSFLTNGISTAVFIAVVSLGWLGQYFEYVNALYENPFLTSTIFFGSLFLLNDIISIPISLYSNFTIEEKYGFNKMTVKTFFMDKLKGYALMAIIGLPILLFLIWAVLALDSHYWWVFWALISIFSIVMSMFYTSLIVPLFNKLTPLEDGELRQAIEKYALQVDFPLTNILVIDGSKRSSKSNAYFSGMGKQKKIVLYDTLIDNHTTEELVAVLAHEVGHYKKKHTIQGMISSVFQTGCILFISSLIIFNKDLSLALGGKTWSIELNLIAFALLFSPVSTLTGVLSNMLSRKNEFEADQYATDTYSGPAIIAALKKLSKDNLSNLTPHNYYVFMNYSHPPVSKRIEHVKSLPSFNE